MDEADKRDSGIEISEPRLEKLEDSEEKLPASTFEAATNRKSQLLALSGVAIPTLHTQASLSANPKIGKNFNMLKLRYMSTGAMA